MNLKDQLLNSLKKQIKESFTLETPPTPTLGDYSLPCFRLTKKPLELQKSLKLPRFIEKTEIKGLYLNFFINQNYLAESTITQILKEKDKFGSLKSPGSIMLEFSQPNTHKAFHIGHVRGTSLGESLARIMEFSGKRVIRANYSGDTGMHIAKWIWGYQNFHKNEEITDDESWIAKIYVEAVKKLTKNENLQSEVDEINRKIESKEDKKINALWKKTRALSIKSWNKIYKELGTKFDVHFFESEVEIPGKNISEDLLKRGIAVKSEGAVIMDLKEYNLGVWILLRRDGTVLYSAKDLALAAKKMDEFPADKYVVIVGDEQKLHFQQLLKTLDLMELDKKHRYDFLTFGMVRLPTGKMSSRTGDNIIYSDFKQELVNYAKQEIMKRHKDISAKELNSRAYIISIAALKYSTLKQDSNKPVIFKKEEAMDFEGNTGPYIQYAYARASSILRKATKTPKTKLEFNKSKEFALIKQLSLFPEFVEQSCNQLSPNIIANYVFTLAQLFNEFYHECPVLNEPNKQVMQSRLLLVSASRQIIKTSLYLLGIEAPESM